MNGPAIKEALETKSGTYDGVVATYKRRFSVQDKDAITQKMLVKHAGKTCA